MPNSHLFTHDGLREPCNLAKYGIHQATVDSIFSSIVHWLKGEDLEWNQSRYLKVFNGPSNRIVAEFIFFHYNGPPEREMGSGGEFNNCKIYLYDTHCSLSFTAANDEAGCGLSFKYSMRWAEADHGFLSYMLGVIEEHQMKIFESDPNRFGGRDDEVEHFKNLSAVISGVLNGQVIS